MMEKGRTELHITVASRKLADIMPAIRQLLEGLVRLEISGSAFSCSMEPDAVPSDEVPALKEDEIFAPEVEGEDVVLHTNGTKPPWGNTDTLAARLRAALTELPETRKEFRASEIYGKLPAEARPKTVSSLSAMFANLLKGGFVVRIRPGVYVRA